MSHKSELPTPKRLRQARERGQLPRSRLLTGAAASAAALAVGAATAPSGMAALSAWTTALLSRPDRPIAGAAVEALMLMARLAGPAMAAALVAAVAVSLLSTGLLFQPGLVAPKLERLDPVAGFGRIFTRHGWIELGRSLAVAGIGGFVAWRGLRALAPALARASRGEGRAAMEAVLAGLGPVLQDVALALLLAGVADHWLARRRHLRELMMSRDEVKREHKDAEGDPRHKAQRRAAHRQLSQRGPARGVRHATAVVVNPTHLAVALRYDPGECEAPYLVAKGREADALALKAEARRLGIPVVRDVPLARSLIHYDVGEEIPEELYRAAAAVLTAAAGPTAGSPRPDDGPLARSRR